MPDFDVKEKRFEQDIEEYLLTHGGYQKGNPAAFNREKALDTGTFLSMGRATPFAGWKVRGRNTMTMVEGQIVWQE